MAKTELQRILEKQQKEQQKYAREAQNRERAAAVVAGAKQLGTFRVMDDFTCLLFIHERN